MADIGIFLTNGNFEYLFICLYRVAIGYEKYTYNVDNFMKNLQFYNQNRLSNHYIFDSECSEEAYDFINDVCYF